MASSSSHSAHIDQIAVDTSATLHQPCNISFPPCMFGKKTLVQRLFQVSWYQKWEWLHCDIARDCVLYFICCKAVKDRKI